MEHLELANRQMDRCQESAPRQKALEKELADLALENAESQSANPRGHVLYFNPSGPLRCAASTADRAPVL